MLQMSEGRLPLGTAVHKKGQEVDKKGQEVERRLEVRGQSLQQLVAEEWLHDGEGHGGDGVHDGDYGCVPCQEQLREERLVKMTQQR